jgi:hypothetical protein
MTRGMATKVNFRLQGAQNRVKTMAKTAVKARETFRTSSCTLRLKKAETDAIARETRDSRNIWATSPDI